MAQAESGARKESAADTLILVVLVPTHMALLSLSLTSLTDGICSVNVPSLARRGHQPSHAGRGSYELP